MIRLIQRRLIIPRGDTGTFTVPVLATKNTGDVAVFSIIDTMTDKKVFEKIVNVSGDTMTIEFSHYDTVNLPVGKYVWDIKFYQNPEFMDGVLVNGVEVDSYYAAFTMPICEIRQTGDNLLMADDAPGTELTPDQLDILNAAVNETNAAKSQANESAASANTAATTAADKADEATAKAEEATAKAEEATVALNELKEILPTLAEVATSGSYEDLEDKPFIPSRVSDLTDDSGHYIKPANGIPASDLEETYLTAHQDISGKANIADLAAVATSGDYDDLLNKPTIPEVPVQDVQIGGSTILENGIANIPIAKNTNLGIVKANLGTRGIMVTDNGELQILKANSNFIKNATNTYLPVVPYHQHEATFYGLAKAAGDTTQSESNNAVGTYTNNAKTAIQTMLDVPSNAAMTTAIGNAIGNINSFDMAVVQELPAQDISTHTIYLVPKTGETNDVYDEYVYINNAWEMVGNTQIDLSNYVQKTDYATSNTVGLVKVGNGLYNSSDGAIHINAAPERIIKLGTGSTAPIVSSNQHQATFYGLAKAAGDNTQSQSSNSVGTYTNEAKAAIQQMLGVSSAADVSNKADKADTVLDTTLSRGRKANTTVGAASIAFGVDTEASGYYSTALGLNTSAVSQGAFAEGKNTVAHYIAHAEGEDTQALGQWAHSQGVGTVAKGAASFAGGDNTIANGHSSFVTGKYNAADSYDNWAFWTANTSYVVGDKVKREQLVNNEPTIIGYICKEANTDATFDISHWDFDTNHMNYSVIVGNGYEAEDSETHETVRHGSNAYALDWDGNGYYKGDVYVGTNADSTGGTKVATVNDIPDTSVYVTKESIDNAGITDRTYVTALNGEFTVTTVATQDYNFPYARANVTGRFDKENQYRVTVNEVEYILSTRLWYIATSSDFKVYEYLGNLGLYISDISGVPGGTDNVPFIIISDIDDHGSIDVLTSSAGTYTILVEKIVDTQTKIPNTLIYGDNYAPIEKNNNSGTYNGFSIGVNELTNKRGTIAIGYGNKITSNFSTAIGIANEVSGGSSVVLGNRSKATGLNSYAEGYQNIASGNYSHAEGVTSTASGLYSHAETGGNTASGTSSHAEGYSSIASGDNSHAEGYKTQAVGSSSHSSGLTTKANAVASFTQGINSIANKVSQSVFGKNNVTDESEDSYGKYSFIIGNGASSSTRSNAYALDWDGNGHYAGDVYVHANADSTGGTKLATIEDIPDVPVQDVQVNGTSILSQGVANVPIGGTNLGVIKTTPAFGLTVNNAGTLSISAASDSNIKQGTNQYKAIVPYNEHIAVFYGLASAAGDTIQKSSENAVGTYTDNAKAAIQSMLGISQMLAPVNPNMTAEQAYAIGDVFAANGKLYKATAAIAQDGAIIPDTNCVETTMADESVRDVQVAGTSVVSNGVANIPVASNNGMLGLVKPEYSLGIGVLSDGRIGIVTASISNIKDGTINSTSITPGRQHNAVFYGLSKVAGVDLANETVTLGTYPEASKTAIKAMLGVEEGLKVVRLI